MNAPELPTILTSSGRYFNLLAPRPEDVRIEDIAHALGNLCRFTGHTREFYSVAQHCTLASGIVPRRDAMAALLHDASEAYISDISRPLKPHLTNYGEIETRIMEAVLTAFGLPTEIPASVKHADVVLLATEKRDLMPHRDVNDWPILAGVQPMTYTINPLPPRAARSQFMARYWALREMGAA